MTIIIILIITSCADRILRLRDYNKRTIVLPIVIVTSIILVILSYNYFSQTAIQIQELAIDDLQSNAETEAYSISNSLTNAISAITSNLEIIANAPSTMEENISKIQTLLNVGKNTTRNLTDGYYFLNSDGRLEAFTGIEKEENAKFKGIDLSYRSYFQIPKQNEILYISNVINSNDNISRMYISFPILQNKQTYSLETTESTVRDSTDGLQPNVNSNSTVFNGAIVASIEAKTLGNFLQGQIHPSFNGDIAFLDRNGTLLYTQNQCP